MAETVNLGSINLHFPVWVVAIGERFLLGKDTEQGRCFVWIYRNRLTAQMAAETAEEKEGTPQAIENKSELLRFLIYHQNNGLDYVGIDDPDIETPRAEVFPIAHIKRALL